MGEGRRATVSVRPFEQWQAAKATIKRPVDLACFSYDNDHKLHIGSEESLRWYYPCDTGMRLGEHYSTFKKWPEQDEHLDSLVLTLDHLAHPATEENQASDAGATTMDVVTWRGMLTKILTLPYSVQDDGFEMNATCFNGRVYIEEDFASRQQRNSGQTQQWRPRPGEPTQQEMEYWGYRFETLCTMSRPWAETTRAEIEARPNAPTSNYAQYCQIVRTEIGDVAVAMGGEVDAVWDVKRHDGTPTNWVELKTSLQVTTPNQAKRFETKLLKWWAQSFLLGVGRIVVGFRDAQGVLRELQELKTTQIPGMVKHWDKNVCINFLAGVLRLVKNTVVDDGLYKIRHVKGTGQVEIERVADDGASRILPRDFLDRTST